MCARFPDYPEETKLDVSSYAFCSPFILAHKKRSQIKILNKNIECARFYCRYIYKTSNY